MTVGQFLINWMVRSAILTLAGAMLLRIFRVRDASIRLASWTAILCASAAIPMLSSVLPDLPVVVPRDEPVFLRQTVAEAVPARTVSESLLGFPGPVERGRAAGARPDASFVKSFDLIDAVVALYATISIMLLLRIGVGLAIGDRLRRRSTPTALNGVRESKEVSAPVTLGILWPAIVLPTAWREWDRGTLDAVLAHERSHVQHWDPAVQLLSTIHRALLWASPMSWFLHSKIVHAAEEASDDAAVSICDRAGYAEILLDFMTREARGPIWTGLQMARYGDPERRVLRILDESVVAKGVSKRTAALIIGVALPAAYLAAAATAEFAPRLEDVRKLPALQMPYTALPSVVDAGASAVPKKTRIAAAVPVLAQVASQNSAPVNGAPGAAEVRLTVSVTDSAGRYVSGLTAQNFRITAGQISPDISSFGLTDGEHSVVLLNTISGGDEAVNALRNVLDARDQMAVTAGPPGIGFSNVLECGAGGGQPGEANDESLQRRRSYDARRQPVSVGRGSRFGTSDSGGTALAESKRLIREHRGYYEAIRHTLLAAERSENRDGDYRRPRRSSTEGRGSRNFSDTNRPGLGS